MKAFARFAALLLAIGAAPAPAAAQAVEPSDPPVIVAAARSCRDAITAERLDQAALTSAGWRPAEIRHDGQAAESPLRMFSRETVMLLATADRPGCIIVARLRSTAAYSEVVQALTAVFGPPGRTSDNGQVLWLLEGNRAMRIDPTGSRERPSARITILRLPGNSQ